MERRGKRRAALHAMLRWRLRTRPSFDAHLIALNKQKQALILAFPCRPGTPPPTHHCSCAHASLSFVCGAQYTAKPP